MLREWLGRKKSGGTGQGEFGFDSSSSGYMLFYENETRVINTEQPVEVIETSKKFKEQVEQENRTFLRSKIFMDSVSLRFLEDLLEVLNSDKEESVEKLADLILSKDRKEIINEKILMILKKRNVRNICCNSF